MSIYEYNEEEHIRMEREDAFEDGRKAGYESGYESGIDEGTLSTSILFVNKVNFNNHKKAPESDLRSLLFYFSFSSSVFNRCISASAISARSLSCSARRFSFSVFIRSCFRPSSTPDS